MVVDTWMHVRERKNPIINPLTWTYIVGLAIYHLVGAGLWGFMHTLPPVNYYTHGSQVTVSHGHLAFFGAYALLNMTIFYFALPRMKNIRKYRDTAGQWGFWIMSIAMFLLGLVFGVAGILQTYLERFLDIGYSTPHHHDALVPDRLRHRGCVPLRGPDHGLAPLSPEARGGGGGGIMNAVMSS